MVEFPTMKKVSDKDLASVTIGGRTPLNAKITLAPYDPDWPQQFLEIKNAILEAIASRARKIEHVGSTSVPGLSAKPVIDVLLVVEDSSNEDSYVRALEKEGFVLRVREPDWYEHRLFKWKGDKGNIHVFSQGCDEITRMLSFRDALRNDDDERDLYERKKQELASRIWRYTQHYADAKSEVVESILERAEKDV